METPYRFEHLVCPFTPRSIPSESGLTPPYHASSSWSAQLHDGVGKSWLPFRVLTQDLDFVAAGVVKINNIPYTVSPQEILQFISRFAPDNTSHSRTHDLRIHIIMEKPTGKTMDCFVEFPNLQDAADCVQVFYHQFGDQLDLEAQGFQATYRHQTSKLGARNVTLDNSSQGELMSALFPRARFVQFDDNTGRPEIVDFTAQLQRETGWSQGFRGYITTEEVFGLVRFAEQPSRSPFAAKCYSRVYESMISTLVKLPWPATDTYTIKARDTMFQAVADQIRTLASRLPLFVGAQNSQAQPVPFGERFYDIGGSRRGLHNREMGLSPRLMLDLLNAALNVPAFSLIQQSALTEAASSYGTAVQLHPCVSFWPFQTLMPEPHDSEHIITSWLQLLDIGYERLVAEERRTPCDQYIRIGRTASGNLIFVWTEAGAGLSFKDASELEQIVAESVVEVGRDVYRQHENLALRYISPARNPRSPSALIRYPTQLNTKSRSGTELDTPEQYKELDENISPKTSMSEPLEATTLEADRVMRSYDANLSQSQASTRSRVTSLHSDAAISAHTVSDAPWHGRPTHVSELIPSSILPPITRPNDTVNILQHQHPPSTSQTLDLLLGSTTDIDASRTASRASNKHHPIANTPLDPAHRTHRPSPGPIGSAPKNPPRNASGSEHGGSHRDSAYPGPSGWKHDSVSSTNDSTGQLESGGSRQASGSSNTTVHSSGSGRLSHGRSRLWTSGRFNAS